MKYLFTVLTILGLGSFGFYMSSAKGMDVAGTVQSQKPDDLPVATLAGGCFWCLESEFRSLDGVVYTRVGYEGGHVENPTYQQITTGKTGHAEAIEVYYDPEVVSYRELVDYFLRKAHDPTQKNRQGVDIGPQYRSAIFYHDDDQKNIAEEAIAAAEKDNIWKNPIVTELSPKSTFWLGEDYHQQYYEKYEEETGRPHVRVLMKQKNK